MASLGKDIAFLRMEHRLSVEDVYERSHIPLSTLQSIENDSIFEQAEVNTVYIRNFVRSYARVAHINEQNIIHALNLQQRGMYHGNLLTEKQRIAMKKAQSSIKDFAESKIDSLNNSIVYKPCEITSTSKSIQNYSVDEWQAACSGRNSRTSFGFKKTELATLLTLILLLVTLLVYYFLHG
jgi:hypothetical protein